MKNRILIPKLICRVDPGMIPVHPDPGLPAVRGGKTGVFCTIPLHRSPPVIPGMDLDDPQRVRRGKTFFLQDLIVVQTFHIPELADLRKICIGHAQFLALIYIGRAPQAVDNRGQHLCGLLPVFSFISEAGDDPGLVMIAPEHRIPGIVLCHFRLPLKKNAL